MFGRLWGLLLGGPLVRSDTEGALLSIRIGLLPAFAIVAVLVAPAAHAFTLQNKDVNDPFGLPKFDIEEQARNFRSGAADAPSANKKLFETPLGEGTFHFGVQQGSASNFPAPGVGSMFGPEFNSRNTREDFNRVVTPENLR
jgi:hypothetical protein